ncbi:sigma-70 family RNA polymerase sigma factor [Spirillospora sp. NPDC048819]|uniref:RNA polymerase sigma factor n=1 Tax=Spirillospora sp. NPDC048819 TaxID=3155268 RepID=UPI0033C897F4
MPRLSPSLHTADRSLVKGLNEGDEATFAALYDEYGERLYDYALSMSGDAKVAADIVHDTFIDAGRRAPRMRDHLHLSSWLYGAARRRCIRRGRAKVLFWDRDAEFSDVPFLDRAEPDEPVPDRPSSDELHRLLNGALARLEPVDQEVMLLAFRHGLRPARLGAALGLSSRRAAIRVRQGRTELEAALQKEISRVTRACTDDSAESSGEGEKSPAVAVLAARAAPRTDAPTTPPRTGRPFWRALHRGPEDSPADPSADRHLADCADCRSRGRLTAAALLKRAPAPVLPAALRHRVMHTATDPELAGYRADIAARGGALTPSGLPSQPDVPSPFTRRWLFTVGGMAGALVAALVAVFVMGPGISGDSLSWPPFRTQPQPSITQHSPPDGSGRETQPSRGPDGGAPGRPGQAPVSPQTGEKTPEESAEPGQPPPSSNPPVRPGVLVVNPAKVELYGTKTAQVSLAAKSGPVTWTAMTSTNQLVLSDMQGGMPADGTSQVTISLRTFIIGLPGQGTLTFTDSEGVPHTVTVVWGASLL